MVVGNPYKFAILYEKVTEWNIDDTFCNGILFYFLNGVMFPRQLTTATLSCEILRLREKLKEPQIINCELFDMSKEEAFAAIYNSTLSGDIIDCYNHFDITPSSFSDQDCYIFAVSNGEQVRVFASTLIYVPEESRHNLEDAKIEEVLMDINDFKNIGYQMQEQIC